MLRSDNRRPKTPPPRDWTRHRQGSGGLLTEIQRCLVLKIIVVSSKEAVKPCLKSIRVLRKFLQSYVCMMPFSMASSTGTQQVNEKYYIPFLLTASALAAASSLVPSIVPATTSSVILPSGVQLSLFLVFPTQLNYCGTHYELLISVSINFNQFPKLSHSHAC